MTSVVKGAVFASIGNSNKSQYRYQLWRIWDENKPVVLFIGLNPSNACCKEDDKTIAKLTKYSKQWGFGGFYIGNLFAYITPYPAELKKAKKPIGDANDKHLKEMARKCDKIVYMWGNDGALHKRNEAVENMFSMLYCFGRTKESHPQHPLYLKSDLNPIKYIK